MRKRNSPLDDETVRKKSKLVNTMNSGILSIFGFIFFALGIQKGMHTQDGIALLLIGIVLLVLGIMRARMIAKLMQEVEELDEETYQSLTETHKEEE